MQSEPPTYLATELKIHPSYTLQTIPLNETEHVYRLQGLRGKYWATLKIKSLARAAQYVPVILEEKEFHGTLELSLSKDPIAEIVLIVSQLLEEFIN